LEPTRRNRLDESIKNIVKRNYNLYIGDKTAESIKKKLACALPDVKGVSKVHGRDVVTGLPSEMEVSSETVYQAITEYLHAIVDAIKIILERTPPEISSDIIDSGIFVTGGSANVFSLDELLSKETELKINICEDPSNTVVNGLGKIMEDPALSELAGSLRAKIVVS
jgi:rod shape-determining protein MreB